MVGCAVEYSSTVHLTLTAAIKTNIFRQLNWSIRRPTDKQAKQLAREKRTYAQRNRSMEEDPRLEKERAILQHTGWNPKKADRKKGSEGSQSSHSR